MLGWRVMKILQQLLIAFFFLGLAQAQDSLKFHAKPKPLAADAETADWPRFLGPTDDLKTPETHLLKEFPDGGPTRVWEISRGTGQAAPAIADGKLVHLQLAGGAEIGAMQADLDAHMTKLKGIVGEIETASGAPLADSAVSRAILDLNGTPEGVKAAADTLTIGLSAAQ